MRFLPHLLFLSSSIAVIAAPVSNYFTVFNFQLEAVGQATSNYDVWELGQNYSHYDYNIASAAETFSGDLPVTLYRGGLFQVGSEVASRDFLESQFDSVSWDKDSDAETGVLLSEYSDFVFLNNGDDTVVVMNNVIHGPSWGGDDLIYGGMGNDEIVFAESCGSYSEFTFEKGVGDRISEWNPFLVDYVIVRKNGNDGYIKLVGFESFVWVADGIAVGFDELGGNVLVPTVSIETVGSARVPLGGEISFNSNVDYRGGTYDNVEYRWLGPDGSPLGSGNELHLNNLQYNDEGYYRLEVEFDDQTVTSDGLFLNVVPPPPSASISSVGISLPFRLGENPYGYIRLSATVVSDETVSYTWYKNGTSLGAQIYEPSTENLISGSQTGILSIQNPSSASVGDYYVVVSNDGGSAQSNVINVSIAADPVLSVSSNQESITLGDDVVLTANGLDSYFRLDTISWYTTGYLSGSLLGFGSSYIINSVSEYDERTYWFECETTGGDVIRSESFVLTLSDTPPVISEHPTTQSVTSGSSVTISISASGESLSYQWQKGGVAIPGATSAIYTIGSASETDAGSYTVVVSNSAGSVTSNAATLSVEDLSDPGVAAPSIDTQPTSQSVTSGDNVTLSVIASGDSLSYQWETYLPPAGWQNIQGATSSSYTATYNATSDSGAFRVLVSNSAGIVTSEPAQVVVELFTDPLKSYLPTNSRLTWAEAKAAAESEGGYLLELNSYGEWLSVVDFLENSFAAMSLEDRNTFFTTSWAPSGGDAAYLWLGGSDAAVEGEWRWANSGEQFWLGGVDGSAVDGAFNRWGKTGQQNEPDDSGNQDALALALETWPWVGLDLGFELGSAYQWNDISADDQLYFIIEKDLGGPAVEVPSIVAHPTTQSVTSGSSVILSVSASGESLSYQWQKGGVAIAGATNASHTLPSVSANDAGSYTVEVSNSAGSVTSNAATLSVEASNTAPPSLAGKSFILSPSSGGSNSVPDQVTFTADTISFGFSGNLLESDSYSYSNGMVTYDTEERIEFTYTSATGGTYEEGYDEGYGFNAENTGTFVESNISLSLQTNWQHSETMDSALSTQYWQVKSTSGDSVANNEGELNFIFDSASIDSNGFVEEQEILMNYAGALPLDEDWQIVIDDTYVSDSVSQFAMGYQLYLEGVLDCEFGFGNANQGAVPEVYFYIDGGSYFTNQSSADDPRILNGLNFRIQHLASSRELIYSYQPDEVSDWTELARINLSTGAATSLSGNGTLTGQLPSSSQNLFFAVDIDKYSTEATPVENIEIGGIEIGGYTPPPPPASIFESYGSVSLLYGDGYGYYIGDESLSLKYEGDQLGNIPGWTYLGVESDGALGYDVIIRNDGTYEYVRWSLDSDGNITGGDYLSVSELRGLEMRFGQDLDGDTQIGVPPASIFESYGSVSLLYGDGYGYYIGDESLSLKYEGDQLGNIPGWTYLGVESDGALGYDVIIRNDDTYEYVRWSLDSDGNITGGDYLSVSELRGLEMRFGQDLDGDTQIGVPPASIFESYGSVSLLYGDGYGYYIGDESLSLKYEGDQLGNIPGWTYLGVESDGALGYDVIIRNDDTYEYVRWSLDSDGNITGGDYLSVSELRGLEMRFGQDLDGDTQIGVPPASIFESYGSVSLLYGDGYGYYIGDESLSLKYEGDQLGNIPGWTYLGVESDGALGYDVIIRNDGTYEYVRWSLDSDGNITGGDYLSVSELRGLEMRFGQDLDGDTQIGVPPASIFESYGSVSLLYGDGYGYYIGDESLSLKYEGDQLGNIPGWTYLGVESDGALGYDVIIRNDDTYEYVRWSLDSDGNITGGDYLSVSELRGLEMRFGQDLDGDTQIGVPPASIFESYGSVSLLYGDGYGYYIGDESLSLKYEGDQLGNIPGWTYLGVESDGALGYDVIIRNDGTYEYVRWSLDSDGNIIGGGNLSVSELRGLEASFDQDFDGDGYKGVNPNDVAISSLEPGMIINGVGNKSFIGSNNDMVVFYDDSYEGIDVASISYVRTGANTGTLAESAGAEYYYGGTGTYPAMSHALTFSSPNSFTTPSNYGGVNSYTITSSEDLAPTSLAGKFASANGVGYSNWYGGYSSYSDVNFSTSSSGTYYGDLTLPINYTYQKVGPREGRMNATAYDPTYGSVDVSYVYFFLTVSSGYYVGVETFASGLVQTNWGTFDIY